jgi:Holliday junction resolvasome RuvABC endonuclease subunit
MNQIGPRVVGLDLSLTSTGVALPDGTLATITSKRRGIQRCIDITQQLHTMLRFDVSIRVDLFTIEGYSFASRNSQAHALGELGGIIRADLWTCSVPWVDVPPASLKRYATGKGNAPKDQVLVAAVHRLDITPSNSDEADAAWLRALTLDHYGHPLAAMPKTHRTALDKIAWPTLEDA